MGMPFATTASYIAFEIIRVHSDQIMLKEVRTSIGLPTIAKAPVCLRNCVRVRASLETICLARKQLGPQITDTDHADVDRMGRVHKGEDPYCTEDPQCLRGGVADMISLKVLDVYLKCVECSGRGGCPCVWACFHGCIYEHTLTWVHVNARVRWQG